MFVFSHTDLILGADSSDVQLSWLQTLDDLGAEVMPSTNEEEEKIRNASSIFDFEARTIDGEMVSLEKYRYILFKLVSCDCHVTYCSGHVTLIVNVASQ